MILKEAHVARKKVLVFDHTHCVQGLNVTTSLDYRKWEFLVIESYCPLHTLSMNAKLVAD